MLRCTRYNDIYQSDKVIIKKYMIYMIYFAPPEHSQWTRSSRDGALIGGALLITTQDKASVFVA